MALDLNKRSSENTSATPESGKLNLRKSPPKSGSITFKKQPATRVEGGPDDEAVSPPRRRPWVLAIIGLAVLGAVIWALSARGGHTGAKVGVPDTLVATQTESVPGTTTTNQTPAVNADVSNAGNPPVSQTQKPTVRTVPVQAPVNPVPGSQTTTRLPAPLPASSQLATVQFDLGATELSEADQKGLGEVLRHIGEKKPRTIVIEGFTCTLGSPEVNQRLAEARGEAVRDYLVRNGLPKDLKVEIRAYGEDYPVDTHPDEAALSRNRRAVICIQ